MAKWSGKVFFPTASQGNRALAYGHYTPANTTWRASSKLTSPPRQERKILDRQVERIQSLLLALQYGLFRLTLERLEQYQAELQQEHTRNQKRSMPIKPLEIQQALKHIQLEKTRRQTTSYNTAQPQEMIQRGFWTVQNNQDLQHKWSLFRDRWEADE